jgi:HK97 family phage prohead protease
MERSPEYRFIKPTASKISAAKRQVTEGENLDGLPVIQGYGAIYDAESSDLGYFREVYKAGCFTESLSNDIRALVDHDPSKIIGRTASKSLSLYDEPIGLKVEIAPANTQSGRDITESVRRGDVDGMSLGFYVLDDKWSMKNGMPFRELLKVDLFDVSIVTFPAYESTTAYVRGLKEVFERSKQFFKASQAMLRRKLRVMEHRYR